MLNTAEWPSRNYAKQCQVEFNVRLAGACVSGEEAPYALIFTEGYPSCPSLCAYVASKWLLGSFVVASLLLMQFAPGLQFKECQLLGRARTAMRLFLRVFALPKSLLEWCSVSGAKLVVG